MNNDISIRTENGWGIITLTRDKALNSLTMDMCQAIDDTLAAWAVDDAVGAVLLEGEGERAFCAGGDIRWLHKTAQDSPQRAAEFFRVEYRMNVRIHHFPKPYVALMDGVCMGGGVGISMGASHRIATDRTLWAMPECMIGLIPDVGATYMLPRLEGGMGHYLALTGARLKGVDAVDAGVATHFAPSENLSSVHGELLKSGADTLSIDRALMKFTSTEPGALATQRAQIDRLFSQVDDLPDLMARLDADGGELALKALKTIKASSPTSLALTLRALAEAPQNFNDCITREFCVAAHCMAHDDFAEGVRAQVIDKDRNPQWSPAQLADLDTAKIAAYFDDPTGGPLDLSGL